MKEIKTTNAPAAIGPYSQAVVINNIVFTSGQIPVNPQTGDAGVVGYIGLGLASLLGLFVNNRKKK